MKTKKSIDSFDKKKSIEKSLDKVLGGTGSFSGGNHSSQWTFCYIAPNGTFYDDCGETDEFGRTI